MMKMLIDGVISWQVKAGIFVFIAALACGIIYTYNNSIKQAIIAKNELKEANAALEITRKSLQTMTNKKAELDRLLVEKQADEQKARAEAQAFEDAFNLLRKANKQVNFWASGSVPLNPVTGELR